MVLHHHRQHQSQLDADAIPILQAGDELPLLYQDDYMNMLPRRKRHSGGEYSSSSTSGNASGGSDSTSATIASFVRRRGRSVPCDTRVGAIDSVNSTSAGSSDRSQRSDGAIPFVRTRAGSAAAAMSSGRTRTGSLAAPTQSDRRRAASGVLRHFRRRKDDAPPLVFPPPSQQQRRANRRVHFKTTLHPEVMPNALAGVPSYDELLFNVGGLYQTLSFLHDPVPLDDGAASSSTDSSGSHALVFDDSLPPERSMQLMIAEFLYRSAVYLGYPCESKPWLPGFRETKRFSVNDVKRWRRLAHHDWEQEEQQFQSALLRHHSSTVSGSSGSTSSSISSGGRLRAVVAGWLQRRRRHSAPAKMSRAMNSPPPVPVTTDVALLVTIANSCVYCGAFQFTARDIRALCNVDIESKGAPDAA